MVKTMIHRLRQRHRERVREEIAHTVPTVAETDDELLATGCADGHVRLFTIPDGQLLRTLAKAVDNRPATCSFHPMAGYS